MKSLQFKKKDLQSYTVDVAISPDVAILIHVSISVHVNYALTQLIVCTKYKYPVLQFTFLSHLFKTLAAHGEFSGPRKLRDVSDSRDENNEF